MILRMLSPGGRNARCAGEAWHLASIASWVEQAFRGLGKGELMVEQLEAGETSQDEEFLWFIALAEVLLLLYDLEGRRAAGGAQEVG
jgi:hypothetical protein